MIGCAAHCLSHTEDECMAYQYDGSDGTCKLSNESAVENGTDGNSTVEVFEGTESIQMKVEKPFNQIFGHNLDLLKTLHSR